MLDLVINGVSYCAEFLPSLHAYGLSATQEEGGSPFWEGVEESFLTAEALEARITLLQNGGPQGNGLKAPVTD